MVNFALYSKRTVELEALRGRERPRRVNMRSTHPQIYPDPLLAQQRPALCDGLNAEVGRMPCPQHLYNPVRDGMSSCSSATTVPTHCWRPSRLPGFWNCSQTRRQRWAESLRQSLRYRRNQRIHARIPVEARVWRLESVDWGLEPAVAGSSEAIHSSTSTALRQ